MSCAHVQAEPGIAVTMYLEVARSAQTFLLGVKPSVVLRLSRDRAMLKQRVISLAAGVRLEIRRLSLRHVHAVMTNTLLPSAAVDACFPCSHDGKIATHSGYNLRVGECRAN